MSKHAEVFWLIAIKNEGPHVPGDDSATASSVSKLTSELSSVAQVSRFEIPDLRVGTLEKLMSAGDLLHKVDTNVEAVIRKIERQYEELGAEDKLGVRDEPATKYLQNFRWNAAKYPTQRSVEELIRNIVTAATKTESELKDSTAFYTEKKQKVQALERLKEGNLMVANLEDVLASKLRPEQFHDSTYLKTAVIVVPKSMRKAFEETYQTIGKDIVGFGPEDNRDAVKGSPVVPGSAEFIMQDREGYSIFLVTILSKFYDEFKTAAQTARYLVRDYNFQAAYEAYQRMQLEGDGVDQLTLAKREEEESRFQLVHWCKTHYGDAFMAWVHTKAIRLFVESVLRYGLPVNFAAAVVKPLKRTNERKAREKLAKLYASFDSQGMMQMHADDQASAGSEEMFPYVSYSIQPEKDA